jgi:hypothetical protein
MGKYKIIPKPTKLQSALQRLSPKAAESHEQKKFETQPIVRVPYTWAHFAIMAIGLFLGFLFTSTTMILGYFSLSSLYSLLFTNLGVMGILYLSIFYAGTFVTMWKGIHETYEWLTTDKRDRTFSSTHAAIYMTIAISTVAGLYIAYLLLVPGAIIRWDVLAGFGLNTGINALFLILMESTYQNGLPYHVGRA